MFNNNLVFSFILSLANTFMYYLFNTGKYENHMSNRNQELLMVFGISFSMCFFMKSISSTTITNIKTKIDLPKSGDILLTNSTRPPF